ncbi:hypothetical protein [Nocardia sp. BMG111209]|uniref:hypothetical protein n=1 Tax=Nocardia sp. BMG111209 TaxID=1160137 RepID=UPI00035CB7C7|nr:hypothetical protein [Nocardia sp. BMG111209]
MSAPLNYPVPLAVEDFVPVLLTTCGVLLLHRRGPGYRIVVAAALIGAGGFAKATAKLIAAAGGPDLPWLRGMLFPLLTCGFALLYLTLTRDSARIAHRVAAAAVIAASALVAILARSPLPMLVSATVFATLTGFRLIGLARRAGDTTTAVLFGIQLVSFFVLGPLGSRPDQTVALQWTEQLCNTAAQAAFLVAARRSAQPARRYSGSSSTALQ